MPREYNFITEVSIIDCSLIDSLADLVFFFLLLPGCWEELTTYNFMHSKVSHGLIYATVGAGVSTRLAGPG